MRDLDTLRLQALVFLQARPAGQHVVMSPRLAEAIGADPDDDLMVLLAHPVEQRLITTWRAGPIRYWRMALDVETAEREAGPVNHQRTVRAETGQVVLEVGAGKVDEPFYIPTLEDIR